MVKHPSIFRSIWQGTPMCRLRYSVFDVGDARDAWTFKTQARTYKFIVAQMLRPVLRGALYPDAVAEVRGADHARSVRLHGQPAPKPHGGSAFLGMAGT